MRNYLMMGAALIVAGCFGPQTTPELPQRPSTDFKIETLADDLSSPWSVAVLPEGGWLITEKLGRLIWLKAGERREITGLPEDIFSDGQGGLLDVILAPDYETSREIYLSYSYGTSDANGTAILRARFDGAALISPVIIFRASPPKAAASHFGGRLAFLPDETLVLTLGEGFAYREDAQKPDTHLGKLIRLTKEGGVPTDNPFLGAEKDGVAYKPQIFSMGHRNVQGLAFDAVTGDLWSHEHGPRGGDELNVIKAGANYGWPLATTGTDYQGAQISPYKSFAGTEAPLYDWVPSIAPSGLAIYRGDLFSDWQGDALIGGLASRDLRRVDLENGRAVAEEDLLSDLDSRIRDVRVDGQGAILILTDHAEAGQLLRITPK